ncbi:hypothetical protein WA026_002264 [Henosepilachna vigintioctopunctata]|uniref:MutL C-terminal dimerisation domain-containing protein n=1 Tax=Henosepilachna vigintioctopunctata TaxID=420089 RepID=A0AAW1TQV6_9CUCU
MRPNRKPPVENNYEPFMFELKKLPDNSLSKKLNNSFHHCAGEYLNSFFKVKDLTLGKSFNFENLSVSPIPKLIPIQNRTEISEQIPLTNEKFHDVERYAKVLPFNKSSTGSHLPNIYRNDEYVKIEEHSNFQFKKGHLQPIINSRSLYMENVKRNLDNLFFKSRSVIAQKDHNNYTTKVSNREIFTKDSLENISEYNSNESACLWKKFIEGKRKQKNNPNEDFGCEALASLIKKPPNPVEQTAPSEQITLLSKEMLNIPFSPDLFSARIIQNSKEDLTVQPNSQPSFGIDENSWQIEEDILLNNTIISAKDNLENCPPTLTFTCGKIPTNSVKELLEADTHDNRQNYSIPANEENWEWIEKLDHQGNKFYFNIRTGMTNFVCPKHDEGFNFKPRFEFMPKGLSPVLMQDNKVSKTISPNCRIKFHDEILKSYENELDIVKWEKYLKENDPRTFFHELYKKKRNDYETEVPDVYSSKISRSMAAITGEYKYSKALFDDLEVIGQLDLKFIATIDRKQNNLIMFDQHAVHERIRLESLVKEYNGASTPCENITLFVIQCDIKLLKHHEKYLNSIGIYFKTFKNGLTVYKVPLCLYNKVKKEPKQNSWNLAKSVEILLQEIIKQIKMTRGILTGLPKTIHEIINLEACRGAIKFGDYLSEHEMKNRIKDLSQCLLPFQCAHGRPTLVPILNLPGIHKIQFEKLQLKKLKKTGASKSNSVQDLHNSLHRLDEHRNKYFEI